MESKDVKIGNLEKFQQYAIPRREMNKLTGGGKWVYLDGEWVWVDDEE